MNDEIMIEQKSEAENRIERYRKESGAALLCIAENICGRDEAADACVESALDDASFSPNSDAHIRLLKAVRMRALEKASATVAPVRSDEFSAIESELSSFIPSSLDKDDIIDGRSALELIREFVSELDAAKRAAFIERYWYFEPIGAISQKLDIGESKARRLLFGARKELKARFKEMGYIE
ncbi:MAG: hypothetical protein IKZ82_08905 [Clostridia bacterium]|nr:hypothetical protein [Clostridia bacterium]